METRFILRQDFCKQRPVFSLLHLNNELVDLSSNLGAPGVRPPAASISARRRILTAAFIPMALPIYDVAPIIAVVTLIFVFAVLAFLFMYRRSLLERAERESGRDLETPSPRLLPDQELTGQDLYVNGTMARALSDGGPAVFSNGVAPTDPGHPVDGFNGFHPTVVDVLRKDSDGLRSWAEDAPLY